MVIVEHGKKEDFRFSIGHDLVGIGLTFVYPLLDVGFLCMPIIPCVGVIREPYINEAFFLIKVSNKLDISDVKGSSAKLL